MSMEHIVDLRITYFMRNTFLIRCGDFLYIHHFSLLGSFDKRRKNGCFFFKAHVPAISLIVVLCYGTNSMRIYLAISLLAVEI